MPRAEPCTNPDCQAHRTFDLLGKSHVLNLLHAVVHVERRPWRFGELRDYLDVAGSVLSDRLKALEHVGLMVRTEYAEMPPRVEYEATDDAVALDDAFKVFSRWGAKRHRTQQPADA